MTQQQDILELLKNFTSTDLANLKKQVEEQEKSKKAEEQKFQKVIDSIKALGDYDKKAFTQLLLSNEFIENVVIEKTQEEKIVFFQFLLQRKSTKRNFYIYKDESPVDFVKSRKGYWQEVKEKGKEYFLAGMTEAGKAYYNTEAGKKEIDSWF